MNRFTCPRFFIQRKNKKNTCIYFKTCPHWTVLEATAHLKQLYDPLFCLSQQLRNAGHLLNIPENVKKQTGLGHHCCSSVSAACKECHRTGCWVRNRSPLLKNKSWPVCVIVSRFVDARMSKMYLQSLCCTWRGFCFIKLNDIMSLSQFLVVTIYGHCLFPVFDPEVTDRDGFTGVCYLQSTQFFHSLQADGLYWLIPSVVQLFSFGDKHCTLNWCLLGS